MTEFLTINAIVSELTGKWNVIAQRKPNELLAITEFITKNKLESSIPALNEALQRKGLQIVESNTGFLAAAFSDSGSTHHGQASGAGRDHIGGYHLAAL